MFQVIVKGNRSNFANRHIKIKEKSKKKDVSPNIMEWIGEITIYPRLSKWNRFYPFKPWYKIFKEKKFRL